MANRLREPEPMAAQIHFFRFCLDGYPIYVHEAPPAFMGTLGTQKGGLGVSGINAGVLLISRMSLTSRSMLSQPESASFLRCHARDKEDIPFPGQKDRDPA